MLVRHAEDLWTSDYELRVAPGVPFPTRMTVVRLADRSLSLISPVPIDGVLAGELAEIGPVSYLLAPNLLHHLYLRSAHERYPGARLLGPAGLAQKQVQLTFEPLDVASHPALRDTFAAQSIGGAAKLSETVLLHRPSGSLIVTDLVFNIERPPAFTTSMLLRLTGARGRLAQSRVWRLMTDDVALARANCDRILAWDFDRLIVAHGNVVAVGAKERLEAALTYTGPVTRSQRREKMTRATNPGARRSSAERVH